MDAMTSLLTLLAVRWSLSPADAEHRFGHGKAQALAALGQSALSPSLPSSSGLTLHWRRSQTRASSCGPARAPRSARIPVWYRGSGGL